MPTESLLPPETESCAYFTFHKSSRQISLTAKALRILRMEPLPEPHFPTLLEGILPEDRGLVRHFFERILLCEQGEHAVEFRTRREKHIPAWVRCSLYIGEEPEATGPYCVGVLRDITHAKYARLLVEGSLDGASIRDIRNNGVLLFGKMFESLSVPSGYHAHTEGLYEKLVHADDQEFYKSETQHITDSLSPLNKSEFRLNSKKHLPLWVSNRNYILFDDKNRPTTVVGGYTLIDSLHHYNQFEQNVFETCSLTGLPNRYKLHKDFTQRAKEGHERGYVLFVDIDDFSQINRFFDYNAGNFFLQHIATLLEIHLMDGSRLYRNQADSFVQLFPGATLADAQKQMHDFQEASGQPVVIADTDYSYRITTVAIPYSGKNLAPELILKRGAMAIREIRKKGKQRSAVFGNHFLKNHGHKIHTENQLRRCVLQNMRDFFLVYQPLIEAKNERCMGAEALLRWKDDSGEIIYPAEFIPILEEIGLMELVGDWVFKTASTQCKKWLDKGFGVDFTMNINTAAPQLSNKYFAQHSLEHLQKIDLSPRNITIEITENNLMLDFQRGMKQLAVLKESGVRLAIDDFGTGYSSLNYLKTLPVDEIKIDRSFVQGVEEDNYSREVISSIIKLTQSIQRRVCVEGVEKHSQAKMLKAMNADIFQGYLFGKPNEPQNFEQKQG